MKISIRIFKSLSLFAVSTILLMPPAISEAATSDTSTVIGLDGYEGAPCVGKENQTLVGSLNQKTGTYNSFFCQNGIWKYDPNGDLYRAWKNSQPKPPGLPVWPITSKCVTRADLDTLKNSEFAQAISSNSSYAWYLPEIPQGVLPHVIIKMKNQTTAVVTIPSIKGFDCKSMMIYFDPVQGSADCNSNNWITTQLPATLTCSGLKPRYTYNFYYTVTATLGSRGGVRDAKATMVLVNDGKKPPTITFQK